MEKTFQSRKKEDTQRCNCKFREQKQWELFDQRIETEDSSVTDWLIDWLPTHTLHDLASRSFSAPGRTVAMTGMPETGMIVTVMIVAAAAAVVVMSGADVVVVMRRQWRVAMGMAVASVTCRNIKKYMDTLESSGFGEKKSPWSVQLWDGSWPWLKTKMPTRLTMNPATATMSNLSWWTSGVSMNRCETRKSLQWESVQRTNRNIRHTSMASLKINPAMNNKNSPLTNPANVSARTYLWKGNKKKLCG